MKILGIHQPLAHLRESVLDRFTAQQKQIAAIVALAIGFLVAGYLAYRCCFKASAAPQKDQEKKVPSPIQEQKTPAKESLALEKKEAAKVEEKKETSKSKKRKTTSQSKKRKTLRRLRKRKTTSQSKKRKTTNKSKKRKMALRSKKRKTKSQSKSRRSCLQRRKLLNPKLKLKRNIKRPLLLKAQKMLQDQSQNRLNPQKMNPKRNLKLNPPLLFFRNFFFRASEKRNWSRNSSKFHGQTVFW